MNYGWLVSAAMTDTQNSRRWFKRYGFRFTLRTMLVLMTVCAVCLGWLAWEIKFIRERQAWLSVNGHKAKLVEDWQPPGGFTNIPGVFSPPNVHIPFWRVWLGDKAVYDLNFLHDSTQEQREYALKLFPEVKHWSYTKLIEGTLSYYLYDYDEKLQDFHLEQGVSGMHPIQR